MWQTYSTAKGTSLEFVTEACERTVSILKRLKDKGLVKDYGRWVLE